MYTKSLTTSNSIGVKKLWPTLQLKREKKTETVATRKWNLSVSLYLLKQATHLGVQMVID